MREKISGIIISITKYNDRFNVITMYTRSHGRLSFLSPIGSGKGARARQSRLQLLSVIETEITFKQGAELLKLGSVSLKNIWTDIYFHPVKNIIAIFISEFLNRLLRATESDPNLWDYLWNAINLLDRMEKGVENYHIAFLSSLLPFSGIQPDTTSYVEGSFFDMRSGTFSLTPPPHGDFLEREEARMAALIPRINFNNVKALKLSGNDRYRILSHIIKYYSHHYPGMSNIKSLDIIHEIFH